MGKEYRLNTMDKRSEIYISKSTDAINSIVDEVNPEYPWREGAAEFKFPDIPSDTSCGLSLFRRRYVFPRQP